MKSRFAYLLISVLFLSEASAQSYKQRNQFVGRVKAIRIDQAYLDDNGDPDERGRHLACLRAFDTNGNLTMSEDFYAYGKISYGKDTYIHDSAGRMIEKAHEINGSVYKTTYVYDEQGRLATEEAQNNHLSQYIYDPAGKLKEIKRSYADGTGNGKLVFSYDENGRPARKVLYNSRGARESEEAKAYDADGNLLSEVGGNGTRTYNARGDLLLEISGKNPSDRYYRRVVYEYNPNNLIAKQQEYDNKGLWRTFLYAYEYDAQGNWIKEVTTQTSREEEKQVWESYRTISYY